MDTTPHQCTPSQPGDADGVRPSLQAVPPAREPANLLTQNSLDAVADYREANDAYKREYDDLISRVDPFVKTLVDNLMEAHSDLHTANAEIIYCELARHFPLLAPAIPVMVTHILTSDLTAHGSCCTGRGEHAAVNTIPPGVKPRQSEGHADG